MKPDLRTDDMKLNMHSLKDLADLFRKARKIIIRILGLVSAVVMLPLFSGAGQAAEPSQTLMKTKMDIGFPQSVFRGVNLLDGKAAMKVLGRTIGRLNGYNAEISVHTFPHAGDILSSPLAGDIELMLLDSWSYVEIEQAEWIEPAFVSSEQGQVANRYLLLTRKKGNLNRLTDLRGKSLNLLTASNATLGIPWLQTLLLEQHLGRPEDFFSQVDYQNDPMRTILQVFFGKKDAALVDATRFELMTELNPQLNRMKAIETSEPFVSYVMCVKRSGWSPPRLKHDIFESGKSLHLEPKAQQIFTLFKFERLVPFEYNHLNTVRRLRQRAIDAGNQSTATQDRLNAN